MDTAYFLQQLINGVTLGSVYGLIAIGYTMVYGIIGMINFAHGDIFMVGAFIALISFILFALNNFMICHRIGRPPISIIGFGFMWDSSLMRVPKPPARITALTKILP